MRIDELEVVDFRPYERASVSFGSGVTLICGPNGSGKTSILEAVTLATTGSSPRTADDRRCIRTGTAGTRVAVEGHHGESRRSSSVAIERGQPRRTVLDGTAATRADLARAWRVLVFLPERLLIVSRAPALRRAYLDAAISRVWSPHGRLIDAFAGGLAQRAAILRRGGAPLETLDAWDAYLTPLAIEIGTVRRRYCTRLGPWFARHLDTLGGGPGQLTYVGEAFDRDEFLSRLRASRQIDLRRGLTTVGPHHDDVQILESGQDIRLVGSQGEQRRAFLALLLAEADLLNELTGDRAVLLLDDVFSELDAERRHRLACAARASGGQVLITATEQPLGVEVDDLLAVEQSEGRSRICR